MNVRDTLYYGDTLTCQTKYVCQVSKDKKAEAWTQNHVINTINLTLRSKFKVVSGSWMYLTHLLMMIDPCAKYGMPMSKLTEVKGCTWRYDKSLLIWPWGQRSTSNQDHECKPHSVLWWYAYVPNRVSQCQSKKSYGPNTKTCQKPYKFDLKVKVQGRIWIMNVCNTSSHGDTPMYQIW